MKCIMYIIVLEYILYNSQCCAHKKCAQHWCIYHLSACWHLETPQGVQGDSMGVGAVEIGRNYAPDHRRRHQEAPKRIPATPAAFLRCWFGFLQHKGGWGGLCPFQLMCCRCWA